MRFLVKRPIKNLTPKKGTWKIHQYKGKVCSSGSFFSPTQERKHNKTRTRHVNVDSDSTEDDSDEFSEHVSAPEERKISVAFKENQYKL
jgi:hypothetical protein